VTRAGPRALEPGSYEIVVSGPSRTRFRIGNDGRLVVSSEKRLSHLHERLATGAGENCEHQHAVLLLVTQGQERIGARCAPRRYERRAHRDGHKRASNDRERQRVTRGDAVE